MTAIGVFEGLRKLRRFVVIAPTRNITAQEILSFVYKFLQFFSGVHSFFLRVWGSCSVFRIVRSSASCQRHFFTAAIFRFSGVLPKHDTARYLWTCVRRCMLVRVTHRRNFISDASPFFDFSTTTNRPTIDDQSTNNRRLVDDQSTNNLFFDWNTNQSIRNSIWNRKDE